MLKTYRKKRKKENNSKINNIFSSYFKQFFHKIIHFFQFSSNTIYVIIFVVKISKNEKGKTLAIDTG